MINWMLAVKLIFTALLLYFVYISIDLNVLWEIMLGADLILLAAAVFFYAMTFVVGGIRWQGINNALACAVPLSFCVRIFFVGGFFSQFLVGGGYGGDAYRIWVLARRTGQNMRSFITVFIDRASGLVGAIIVIATLAPVYWLMFPEQKQILMAISITCAASAVIIFLLAYAGKCRAQMAAEHDQARPIASRVNEVLRNLGLGFLSWPVTSIHLIWSLIALVFNMLAMAAIGAALGLAIDFWVYLTLGPIVFLAKSFPLSFAGWGAREVAMIYFFGFVGIDNDSAVAMSVMAGVLVLLSSLPGGLLWLMNKDHVRSQTMIKKTNI